MLEAWTNFTIIVFVQLILFVIHAYYEKKLFDAPRILGQGILSGIVLGLFFDFVLGKFFGLWSYTLGFDAFFVTLNAALLYGLFAANTLMMRQTQLQHFFIWIMVVTAVFEITNLFFHSWTWEFTLPGTAFLAVLLAGNFGGAILVAVVWHAFGYRFLFIDNFLKK